MGFGRGYQSQLGGIGSADDDEAGFLVSGDQPRVLVSGEVGVLQGLDAGVMGLTDLCGPQVLDQHGHAAKRSIG